MRVVAHVSQMEVSDYGTVSFPLFVQHQTVVFPDDNWWEIGFGVLGMWGGAISDLLSRGKGVFWFMEGPYLIEVLRRKNVYFARCGKERSMSGYTVLEEFDVEIDEFLESYLSVGTDALKAYRRLNPTPDQRRAEEGSVLAVEAAMGTVSRHLGVPLD